MNQRPEVPLGGIYMRGLLSFIVITASFGSSLLAGVAAAAEPFNWSPQFDDPIHTPAELVESMHSAFGYNHCRAVHAKGIILQGEFTPDTHAREITKAPHLQGASSKITVRFSDFSGVPTIPDNDPMANPRGMAIISCYLRQANSYSRMREERNKAQTT